MQRHHSLGMIPALHARLRPDTPAVITPAGRLTFAELNARANRLASALRDRGVGPGDHLAVLLPNVAAYAEAYLAAMRSGLRLIPVNSRLSPEEVAYIVRDCDAKALIAHACYAPAARLALESPRLEAPLAVGGEIEGFDPYEAALGAGRPEDPSDPVHGLTMFYTSGTTGRPKGVYRAVAEPRAPQWGEGTRKAFREGDVCLLLGPAYHAAPLGHSLADALWAGATLVMTEKFDAEATLALIEQHRVTHAHMVSTMFQRILALPEAVRGRYDLSSLHCVVHGAAPTPLDVKRAMIDWWGPVLQEYYGASEGSGGFYIVSDEWLRKPGSVGRRLPDWGSRVVSDDGRDCEPGEVGRIFFRMHPRAPFEYYKDPEKTQAVLLDGTYFTVGDMGYLDEDDYLFLTGRTAECIISGGVNIYPQEIDDELLKHPAVLEACTVGAPNDEWGEEVKAVVVLQPGASADERLETELIAFIRGRLAPFKAPRSVDFVASIPRSEAGKVLRGQVRAPFWAGRDKQI
ncbi:AMP-binding protein [Caulobacter sp. KR2-114]|uniref:AMP-binding protein n=1 Tax=Caulobacter sp. KR2-114 TaxID=3400912 RepID=UPI003C11FF8D